MLTDIHMYTLMHCIGQTITTVMFRFDVRDRLSLFTKNLRAKLSKIEVSFTRQMPNQLCRKQYHGEL